MQVDRDDPLTASARAARSLRPGFYHVFEQARDAAAHADRVVCPSEHAKKDIVCKLDRPSRIVVIPEAPAPVFRVLEPSERTRKIADPYLS